MPDVDDLLTRVHRRLGGGVDIQTFASGEVEVRWRRLFESDELSDERFAQGHSLRGALEAVLAHEDDVDRMAAEEAP